MTGSPERIADWPAAWERLGTLENAEWEAESERLDFLWIEEYRAAFIDHAMRRGWQRGDAEAWALDIAWDALLANADKPGAPGEAAHKDVPECEIEMATAPE